MSESSQKVTGTVRSARGLVWIDAEALDETLPQKDTRAPEAPAPPPPPIAPIIGFPP